MDGPDEVALEDAAEHDVAGRHLTEDGVVAVQVRLRTQGDEPLAAAGVRPGERHPDGPGAVSMAVDLVADDVAGAAPPVAARVAVLHHEVGDHPVPAIAVEVAGVD